MEKKKAAHQVVQGRVEVVGLRVGVGLAIDKERLGHR
jgi:hypothetical protein